MYILNNVIGLYKRQRKWLSRIDNQQETDNCITTIIYTLSFAVTIFMYQTQLINTEILNDKIKRNNK